MQTNTRITNAHLSSIDDKKYDKTLSELQNSRWTIKNLETISQYLKSQTYINRNNNHKELVKSLHEAFIMFLLNNYSSTTSLSHKTAAIFIPEFLSCLTRDNFDDLTAQFINCMNYSTQMSYKFVKQYVENNINLNPTLKEQFLAECKTVRNTNQRSKDKKAANDQEIRKFIQQVDFTDPKQPSHEALSDQEPTLNQESRSKSFAELVKTQRQKQESLSDQKLTTDRMILNQESNPVVQQTTLQLPVIAMKQVEAQDQQTKLQRPEKDQLKKRDEKFYNKQLVEKRFQEWLKDIKPETWDQIRIVLDKYDPKNKRQNQTSSMQIPSFTARVTKKTAEESKKDSPSL